MLPSYYPEGVPRALIEAAAMGKPVITTDSPGCRDVVDADETGYPRRSAVGRIADPGHGADD